MMLLAFETVARTASACLVSASGDELEYADLGGGEAELGLVALLDGLLRRHGRPSALAVAAGPGSFTGLRIGITAARTIAWLDELPVHALDASAALASEQGPGLWWVLTPLKRDTTFHALVRVAAAGRVEVLADTAAAPDADPPAFHPLTREAVAVGPALNGKPGLAERWCPGVRLGSSAGLTARGVARLAPQVPARPWAELLPRYLQEPAPVLQRRAAERGAGTLRGS